MHFLSLENILPRYRDTLRIYFADSSIHEFEIRLISIYVNRAYRTYLQMIHARDNVLLISVN